MEAWHDQNTYSASRNQCKSLTKWLCITMSEIHTPLGGTQMQLKRMWKTDTYSSPLRITQNNVHSASMMDICVHIWNVSMCHKINITRSTICVESFGIVSLTLWWNLRTTLLYYMGYVFYHCSILCCMYRNFQLK